MFLCIVDFSFLLSWKSLPVYSLHLCSHFCFSHYDSLFRFYTSCKREHFLQFHFVFHFYVFLIKSFLFCLLASILNYFWCHLVPFYCSIENFICHHVLYNIQIRIWKHYNRNRIYQKMNVSKIYNCLLFKLLLLVMPK